MKTLMALKVTAVDVSALVTEAESISPQALFDEYSVEESAFVENRVLFALDAVNVGAAERDFVIKIKAFDANESPGAKLTSANAVIAASSDESVVPDARRGIRNRRAATPFALPTLALLP